MSRAEQIREVLRRLHPSASTRLVKLACHDSELPDVTSAQIANAKRATTTR